MELPLDQGSIYDAILKCSLTSCIKFSYLQLCLSPEPLRSWKDKGFSTTMRMYQIQKVLGSAEFQIGPNYVSPRSDLHVARLRIINPIKFVSKRPGMISDQCVDIFKWTTISYNFTFLASIYLITSATSTCVLPLCHQTCFIPSYEMVSLTFLISTSYTLQ